MTRFVLAALLGLSLAAPAFAHDPRPGPNGGLKVDAGARHHAELVANGTPQVVVFLYDQNDRPVAALPVAGALTPTGPTNMVQRTCPLTATG